MCNNTAQTWETERKAELAFGTPCSITFRPVCGTVYEVF
jgi:hypothetical protein